MIQLFSSEKKTKFALKAKVLEFDNGDLLVAVEGGRSHIGAVGLSLPRPSMSLPGRKRASKSIFTVFGHRDDEIVNEMSDLIVEITGRTAVVVAGAHFAALRSDEIALLRQEWCTLAQQIAQKFKPEFEDD